MKYKTVYLDMDGTLADFAGAAVTLVGFSGAEFKDLNILSPQQKAQQKILFDAIDNNPDFFETEQPYFYTAELYNICRDVFDDVVILSNYRAPAGRPHLFQTVCNYKIDWVHKYVDARMPKSKIIVTESPKYNFANRSRWLIDDMPQNVSKWVEYGGKGILFDNWDNVKNKLLQIKGNHK